MRFGNTQKEDLNHQTETMNEFAFRNDRLQENQLNIEVLRLLRTYDDAMETTIRGGDLLMIDTSQTALVGMLFLLYVWTST